MVDNGTDAIKMIGEGNFDLVLCDLAMPDVFGCDVVKALNWLIKRLKIDIISGWTDGFASITDKEFKIDFYLKKPFKHAELLKHTNELFV